LSDLKNTVNIWAKGVTDFSNKIALVLASQLPAEIIAQLASDEDSDVRREIRKRQ
jgi:hypothetical protein